MKYLKYTSLVPLFLLLALPVWADSELEPLFEGSSPPVLLAPRPKVDVSDEVLPLLPLVSDDVPIPASSGSSITPSSGFRSGGSGYITLVVDDTPLKLQLIERIIWLLGEIIKQLSI